MNVLMFSSDKTVINGAGVGDAVNRLRSYGQHLAWLSVIVYTNKKEKFSIFNLSKNVIGIPSNSFSKIFFFFDALKIFRKLYCERKIDLIICQDPFIFGLVGVWLKRQYGVKLLLHFHGDYWDNPAWLKEEWINYLFFIISKFTVKRADGIRVMSEGQKKKLIIKGIAENKIRVIATPIDLKKFMINDNLEAAVKIKDRFNNRALILMVGRKDKVKGFEILFKAMKLVQKSLSNAALVLAGNYIEKEINALPEVKNLNVIAFGNINSDNLPAFYQAAELVVSSSYSESFGKTLVEANACARPVVATATTGAQEIVKDGYNGFLVPVNNPEALAEKIIYLLKHPKEAKIMGENGRRLVLEKYGNNTEKLVKFWQEIVAHQN